MTSRHARVAVALAGAVVVGSAILAWTLRRGEEPSVSPSPLARLRQAIIENADAVSDLAGGDAPATRGGTAAEGSASWLVLDAAAQVRRAADADYNPANQHALGLAHLALGEFDQAIREFREATLAEPTNPVFRTDLAAALLERARRKNRPDDLPLALSAALKARHLPGAPMAAAVNASLALDSLYMHAAAEGARAALPAASRARASRFAPAVDRQERIDAGAIRLAFEDLFAESPPAQAIVRGRQLAADYKQVSGHQFLEAQIELLARDPRLVEAQRRYALGLRAMNADRVTEARRALTDAQRGFETANSQYAWWAAYRLASMDVGEGRLRAATKSLDRLESLSSQTDSRVLRAHVLWSRANADVSGSQYLQSVSRLVESIGLLSQAHELVAGARVRNQLADVYDFMGDARSAWLHWRDALRVTTDTSDDKLRHSVFDSIAGSLLMRSEADVALIFAKEDREALSRLGAPVPRLYNLVRMGRILLALGRRVEADELCRQAVHALAPLADDPRRPGLEHLVATLQMRLDLAQGQHQEALAGVEVALKTLAPQLTLRRTDLLLHRALAEAELGMETRAVDSITAGVESIRSKTGQRDRSLFGAPDTATGRDMTDAVIAALGADALGALRAADAMRSVEVWPGPVGVWTTLDELRLGPGSGVLYFVVLLNTTRVWLLDQNGLHTSDIGVGRADLALLTARLRRSWRPTGGLDADAVAIMDRLSSLLIGPIRSQILALERMTIVPDWPLFDVPFSALRTKADRYLIEDVELTIAPSLAGPVRSRHRRPTPHFDIVAVGGPQSSLADTLGLAPVPAAVGEVQRISRLYKAAHVATGAAATKRFFLADATRARVVHVAAHAVSDPSDAALNRLLLADDPDRPGDSAVTAAELANLDLRSAAVVLLAACSTAVTDERPRSPVSFASQVLAAGATSVVATMWDVDDSAAAVLFERLHVHMAAGASAPAAQRRAQVEAISASRNAGTTSSDRWTRVWPALVTFGTLPALE